MRFMIDPKNNKQSVSLTLMMISFVLLVAAGVAEIFKQIDSIGPFIEIYVVNTVLYFGRRASFKSKFMSIDQEADLEKDA